MKKLAEIYINYAYPDINRVNILDVHVDNGVLTHYKPSRVSDIPLKITPMAWVINDNSLGNPFAVKPEKLRITGKYCVIVIDTAHLPASNRLKVEYVAEEDKALLTCAQTGILIGNVYSSTLFVPEAHTEFAPRKARTV